ncbi:ATP-binding protein [Aquabacterium sp. CECT 9606]|uniref:hybrid sensor histidine kinase/response regulator n=1 Tax=Aquabacterium sp. CECT 9606 TaxID=2845822 RepID=UPI001E482E06|nr:ATP-binding protein [Aquabacterium sp. CECT 9606]CAH0354758.1 Sensor protein EvgS [Aquabacterium sp. CECT 9606]
MSEMPFQRFTESSDDVFWLADLKTRQLLYVNSRFEHFWGIDGDALLKDPSLWNQAVVEADAHLLPSPFFADTAASENSLREYQIMDAQGQCHWIRDRRFYVRDAHDQAVRVGGIAEDITERKQAEIQREQMLQREQLARKEAEALALSKDEFLAVVTHELRSPLNALRGWAHVLRRAGELSALQEKALDAIDRNTQAQARLVDDLLDSQRILRGTLELQLGLINLASLVDDTVASMHDQAAAKRITLEVNHDNSIDAVSADLNRLRQAVTNLLSNAIKFSPEEGLVSVRTLRLKQAVAIEVKDRGIGLAATQLPFLFNRFQQADSSSTRRQSGLGLGLSLAQQVIELHGGRITAHSEGMGLGATFTIELPDQAKAVTAISSQPQASLNALAGKRVVVVEDDPDGREILELLLRDANVEPRSFDRAAGAYEHLAHAPPEEQPDALISDIAMPDEDGYAFIQRVREMEARLNRPRMVALALTAFSRKEDRQRALAAGFDEHVGKPIDSQVVLQTLESALDNKRAAAPTS